MAAITLKDDNGQVSSPDDPNAPSSRSSGGSSDAFDAAAEVNKIFAGSGIAPGETDIANLAAKNPEDRASFLSALATQRDQRLSSNGGSGGASSGGSSSGGSSAPSFANTSPQFTDPTQRRIEDYALDQFNRQVNPDPNSGQAQLEAYLKTLAETLQQPVYSPQDVAVIKGQAIDSIEQERQATKRSWIEEVGRRGFAPTSGVALQGIQHIDDQFNKARTSVDATFAQQAIGQTQQQRLQVADVLSQLAGTQNTRLANALTYATLPYQLSQNAFQNGLQLVGAGGNPTSLLNSALSIAQLQQQASQIASANRSALSSGLLQYLGYLFGNA